MAKKTKSKHGAKTQAIREYLTAHPGAGPTEASKELTKQGIIVSPAYVSAVKGSTKQKRGRGKADGSLKRPEMVDVDCLLKAKKLAEALGGVEKARAALETLAKITG